MPAALVKRCDEQIGGAIQDLRSVQPFLRTRHVTINTNQRIQIIEAPKRCADLCEHIESRDAGGCITFVSTQFAAEAPFDC